MSGLTMAYMSFDELSLKVFEKSGTDFEKICAQRIANLLKRRHLLLVVLLISNAAAMEALPMCLDKISSPAVAMVMSVSLVLLFGEVIPQAVFMRFRLVIGAHLHWLVWALTVLLFVVAFPISAALDLLLGTDHGTVYSRVGLKELADLHHLKQAGPLTHEEVAMLKGVLELQDKDVSEAMTDFQRAYVLPYDAILDHELIACILSKGFSRIPVYRDEKSNIVGVLLVKQLIPLNPAEARPLSSLRLRKMMFVPATTSQFDMLELLKRGQCMMAMVVGQSTKEIQLRAREAAAFNKPPPPEPKLVAGTPMTDRTGEDIRGLVTLEDIIESLIGGPINDETDAPFWELYQQSKVKRLIARAASKRRDAKRDAAPLTISLAQQSGTDLNLNSDVEAPAQKCWALRCCKHREPEPLLPTYQHKASCWGKMSCCAGLCMDAFPHTGPYQTLA
eukprot:TRINITY_DN1826_c0_g1_i2.p1 TRINITY_DN1826_c0_g1~~TRINITY_DN1826_c0_g1_i2.p1  ORF type:complete len:448 (-),score=99.21 TRINITY_DN1826_c0_g1_i2:119-1462(-)